jgi:hypothetical protein
MNWVDVLQALGLAVGLIGIFVVAVFGKEKERKQ